MNSEQDFENVLDQIKKELEKNCRKGGENIYNYVLQLMELDVDEITEKPKRGRPKKRRD